MKNLKDISYSKLFVFLCLILIIFGCDPVTNIFVSNESNYIKEVKVKLNNESSIDFDSIQIFNNSNKLNWKNSQNSKRYTSIHKDSANHLYKFLIKPNEAILLRPAMIGGTQIKYVVIDYDTSFFYEKHLPQNKFTKIGMHRYVKRIQ